VLLLPALLVPLTAATLGFAGYSSASSPAHTSYPVKCISLTGTIGETGTISGCTESITGGSGTFSTADTSPATITWENGETTTVTFNNKRSGTLCQAAHMGTTYKITGTVTADTTGSITVGSTIKGAVCLHSKTTLSLAPKTTLKI
jgi:hypothetical protein